MAESTINEYLPPSGYEEDFVNTVEEDFQCLICHLPLKEPVLTRCGHRFCKECLEEHNRRQEDRGQSLTCPADRQGLDRDRDIFPDKATERKIISFAIRCPSDGCEWTGELREKKVHLESCPCKLVPCTNDNCYVTVKRRNLKRHVTIKCPWRILECDYCSEPHPECQMQGHIEQCSKYPVTCSNDCGLSMPRETVLTHIEDDCPLTVISCPYAQMGCETKVQRRAVESHLESAMKFHLDLACVKLHNTEAKLNDLSDKLNDTKVKLNNTEVKLNNTEVKLNNTEVKLNNTKVKLNNTEVKLSKNDAKLNETKDELKKAMDLLQTTNLKLEKTRETVDTRIFIWKIDGFSELLRQAKTGGRRQIQSDPFYTALGTESYGYKLKVNITLNGEGIGENTHLSVFIIVMKGEYDAILSWPFRKRVKFTLIDQQEDADKQENVTKEFAVIENVPSFVRPVTEENVGRGFGQFISHEKLDSRRYIVDDTLFLQVQISSRSPSS